MINTLLFILFLFCITFLGWSLCRPSQKVILTHKHIHIETLLVRGHLFKGVGLLNTPSLPPSTGILLYGTSMVHTKGMHFSLDLVFLNHQFEVIKIEKNVLPGKKIIKSPSLFLKKSHTLELLSGEVERNQIKIGMIFNNNTI